MLCILGLYRDNGRDMETTIVYWGYVEVMARNKTEDTYEDFTEASHHMDFSVSEKNSQPI